MHEELLVIMERPTPNSQTVDYAVNKSTSNAEPQASASLCQPSHLRASLSSVCAQWLGRDASLLDSHAYLRRLFPGKRCSLELELVVGRNCPCRRPPIARQALPRGFSCARRCLGRTIAVQIRASRFATAELVDGSGIKTA